MSRQVRSQTNRVEPVDTPSTEILARVFGLPGAVLMGLGSILGTGIFVSTGIAAGVGGPAVVPVVILAALLALFNGLSSAHLAGGFGESGPVVPSPLAKSLEHSIDNTSQTGSTAQNRSRKE